MIGHFNSLINPEHYCKCEIISNRTNEEERKIGPLTLSQRKEKIRKYKEKRQKRLWNVKIRYNIRKENAQKKFRIKGRFAAEKRIDKGENRSMVNMYKLEIPIIDKPIFTLKKIMCKQCAVSHKAYHSVCT